MKNNQLIWAKTILTAYKHLGTLSDAIDKLIESTAKNSFFSSGIWSKSNSISEVSKKIIHLTDKKVDYINLKVITEKIIGYLNKNHAKILILRYLKNLDIETISKVMNMTERSFFRKMEKAQSEFTNTMTKLGYTAEKMEVNYLKDMFIESIYSGLKNTDKCEVEQREFTVCKNAFQEQIKNLTFGLV